MKQFILGIMIIFLSINLMAQKGGLSNEDLNAMKSSYHQNSLNVAISNAVQANAINKLCFNHEKNNNLDFNFSHKVKTSGITNQESSGRCWLFSGLNVLKPKVMEIYDVSHFEFSHVFSFFYDQLEKSNLFLEAIIETSELPITDRKVDWLFDNTLSDGGQWTGVVNIIEKYGVAPKSAMTETYNSENTRYMAKILTSLLRQYGLELREMAKDGKKDKKLTERKLEMMQDVYRILATTLGTPPERFQWNYKSGEEQKNISITPIDFFKSLNVNLYDYVMLMNDPVRPYNKVYEIEFDRHTYDGQNWKYINLPNDQIKEFAKKAIMNNEALYFSCDVGKQLNRAKGVLDVNNYDYASLMQIESLMDKKQRILCGESASSHAMTLIAVDVAEDGSTKKWLLENSWGASNGHKGCLMMTDAWWDEYMFRVVVPKKYVSEEVLKLLETKTVILPPWDPMFLDQDINF